MKLRQVKELSVSLDWGKEKQTVGKLVWQERRAHFRYDQDFLKSGLEISPFKLRSSELVFSAPTQPFEGLHGVFNDSLPDGWGRLLMDRKVTRKGISPWQLTPLDRLAWVGRDGVGALCYEPIWETSEECPKGSLDLDILANEAKLVLEDSPKAVLERLLAVGASPQGARPKAVVAVSPEGRLMAHGARHLEPGWRAWLIKFPAQNDPKDVGALECTYADMARAAGVDMPETRLFPSENGSGYFGIRLFDRVVGKRFHQQTASGLLEIDHGLPAIGYDGLIRLTRTLTRHEANVHQIFSRMVFNVLAHNRDDHTKNHAFLMSREGEWRLSPGYDITFSNGPGGEHALDIAGEGRTPTKDHVLSLAEKSGLRNRQAVKIIDQARAAIADLPMFAKDYGVSKKTLAEVLETLKTVDLT